MTYGLGILYRQSILNFEAFDIRSVAKLCLGLLVVSGAVGIFFEIRRHFFSSPFVMQGHHHVCDGCRQASLLIALSRPRAAATPAQSNQ